MVVELHFDWESAVVHAMVMEVVVDVKWVECVVVRWQCVSRLNHKHLSLDLDIVSVALVVELVAVHVVLECSESGK